MKDENKKLEIGTLVDVDYVVTKMASWDVEEFKNDSRCNWKLLFDYDQNAKSYCLVKYDPIKGEYEGQVGNTRRAWIVGEAIRKQGVVEDIGYCKVFEQKYIVKCYRIRFKRNGMEYLALKEDVRAVNQ